MIERDFEAFRGLLNRCAEVFGKAMPSDVVVQGYWRALRDLELVVVEQRAAEHCKRGKFFPKPFELRPREDKAPLAVDRVFTDAQRSSAHFCEQLRAERGEEAWRNYVWLCRLDRIIATDHPASPIYLEAVREARILRPLVRGY